MGEYGLRRKSKPQRDIHWLSFHHGRNQKCRTSWRKREETPFQESSSDNKYDAIKSDDISIKNFIVALKVTSTVKSTLRIDLAAQDKNRLINVVVNAEEERNMILSNLGYLKNISEYKTISPTEDYTITERRMIKDLSNKVKEKNKKEWITWFQICMETTR